MQVNNVGYTQQAYGTSNVQPVTYAPYSYGNAYRPDMYQGTQQTGAPTQSKPAPQYVTKQSVALGIAGAGIGFLIGGPIGALIGGVGALLLSVIGNIFKICKDDSEAKKQQQAMTTQGPVSQTGQGFTYQATVNQQGQYAYPTQQTQQTQQTNPYANPYGQQYRN